MNDMQVHIFHFLDMIALYLARRLAHSFQSPVPHHLQLDLADLQGLQGSSDVLYSFNLFCMQFVLGGRHFGTCECKKEKFFLHASHVESK